MPEAASWPDAVEVDRVVPASGNMTVGPQQFWLGTTRAGQQVTLWIDTTTVHLSIGGWRIKTVPSRLTEVDLARLRRAHARPAGPPPAGPSPGTLAASRCVEVHRLVNGIGGITLLNQLVLVGSPLAGQRARIRLDGQLMHVLTQDGRLWRTLPCPIPPGQRHRLQGVRLAGPAPAARQRRHRAAAGVQPRRHPGRPPAHPGGYDPRRQDRHRALRDQHLPAGHRRGNHSRGAPDHQPGNWPLQGLCDPSRTAVNPMPDMKLDVGDAAELAELLQFISEWLARDPGRLGPSLEDFVGHPGLRPCAAAPGPGALCLPARRQRRRAPVRTPAAINHQAPRPADDTPGLTGVNVVRPRAARCGHSTLTPQRLPAWTGAYPGRASTTSLGPAPGCIMLVVGRRVGESVLRVPLWPRPGDHRRLAGAATGAGRGHPHDGRGAGGARLRA